ncbi:MAG: hypothetical protein R2762_07700 [Bryobacteraceae bacterium]
MKLFRFILPAVFLAAGVLINMQPGFAKPEFTKKEKTGCLTCHVQAKKKDLNDVGKCYGEKKDLKACKK